MGIARHISGTERKPQAEEQGPVCSNGWEEELGSDPHVTSEVPEVFVDFKSITGEDHKRVLSKQYGYF